MSESNKNSFFRKKKTLNINGRIFSLETPKIMGILNATPDSFYDGGIHYSEHAAIDHAVKMVEEGADILDIGSYSSRPGATDIPPEEEWQRLKTILPAIRRELPDTIISLDTFRSSIAEKSVKEYNINVINDISGGKLDPDMYQTISRLNIPYIFMHMKGTPQNMQRKNHYHNLLKEILYYFSEGIKQLKDAGIKDVIIDPGFGFAKDISQNFELLRNLNLLNFTETPVLAGLSRKSMIYKTLGKTPDESLNGTIALNAIALEKGADILRVHDVKEGIELRDLMLAYKGK